MFQGTFQIFWGSNIYIYIIIYLILWAINTALKKNSSNLVHFNAFTKEDSRCIRFMGREQKTNPDGIGIKPSGIKVW